MLINGEDLLQVAPIENMSPTKNTANGTSWGLSEVGYDIRIQQKVIYTPPEPVSLLKLIKKVWLEGLGYELSLEDKKALMGYVEVICPVHETYELHLGKAAIASSMEYFDMPEDLWAMFKNKSTLARKFMDASLCTDAEPGWSGNLTIELVFHGIERVIIEPGTGIMKAVFLRVANKANYNATGGKYANQPNRPVKSIESV